MGYVEDRKVGILALVRREVRELDYVSSVVQTTAWRGMHSNAICHTMRIVSIASNMDITTHYFHRRNPRILNNRGKKSRLRIAALLSVLVK